MACFFLIAGGSFSDGDIKHDITHAAGCGHPGYIAYRRQFKFGLAVNLLGQGGIFLPLTYISGGCYFQLTLNRLAKTVFCPNLTDNGFVYQEPFPGQLHLDLVFG